MKRFEVKTGSLSWVHGAVIAALYICLDGFSLDDSPQVGELADDKEWRRFIAE